MSSGHSDLLTIDELPQNPATLSRDIKGIVLVDHAVPLRKWKGARILSIFDHHQDLGAGPNAKPRESIPTVKIPAWRLTKADVMIRRLRKSRKLYKLSSPPNVRRI